MAVYGPARILPYDPQCHELFAKYSSLNKPSFKLFTTIIGFRFFFIILFFMCWFFFVFFLAFFLMPVSDCYL